MAGLFGSVLTRVWQRRRNRARRRDFRKEITLFLKLKLDPARAFVDHRIIQISFALDRQKLLLLAFFQSVIAGNETSTMVPTLPFSSILISFFSGSNLTSGSSSCGAI